MEMRQLGRNGLEVRALCLGTMTFGFQVDEPHSVEILDAAFDRSLTFLGTADAYPLGGSLDTVGATESIDASLKRLQTDYVDLYQSHAFDPRVPIEESLRAFDDPVKGCDALWWQLPRRPVTDGYR